MPEAPLRERWPWEAPLPWLVYLLLLCLPIFVELVFRIFDVKPGLVATYVAFYSLAIPILVFDAIGRRIKRLKAAAQKDAAESQPCLMVDGIIQSPGVVSYRNGQLELRPLAGTSVTISPADITAIREARWFNGKLLIGKTAFWLNIPGRQRLGFAISNSTAASWRERIYVSTS
ncbi:MAG: hypothetical protein RBU21_13145 [FCB group bacterium]|jgi:hypothetical protein|nr:hypothetical protein [FCB group bacterium]